MSVSFDYIIVGAGSAGSIVAGKLSANPSFRVLLVEAGGSTDRYPQVWDANQINCLYDIPQIHWGYKSQPLRYMNNRVMDVWRAKIEGGCTTHNDMVYTRGAPADFDDWVKSYGCTGWSYNEVAQNFAAVEAVLRPTTTTENAFGRDFVNACLDLGIPYNPNYNSGGPLLGVSPHQSTIENGNRRVTSFQKYVAPFLGRRPNLTVVTDALVNRILFSGTRTIGVNLTITGSTQDVFANREVILSAGSINNPQLLMLSGIGAADALKTQGIDPLVDLPGVGENMQDALIFKGVWPTRQPITGQPANLGYAVVWDHPEDAQQPQVCLEMTRGIYDCNQPTPVLEGNYVVTGGAMRQRSRGRVRLASYDPRVAPIIDMNLLSAPGDYEQCRLAFETMRRVGNSPGLSAWRLAERIPGPNVVTEEQIRQWILNNTYSYSHPSGTCAMKAGGLSGGVVDPRLRVYGVTGLRVVDVSIMPRITSGHTQGPAFMIGDKGADMILQDA